MAQSKGKGKGRNPAPANESKSDKFRRLATMRTNKAIAAIRGLGKLGTGQYERTPEEVEKIFEAIGAESKVAYDRLMGKSQSKADSFTL